jgi:periplasmic protein CpxP/Spy
MTQPTHQTTPPARRARPLLLAAAIAVAFGAGSLVTAGGSLAAAAAGMHHPMSPGGGAMHMDPAHMDRVLTEAGATAEQKARIHTIMKGGLAAMGPLHGKLSDTHRQVHDILMAPSVDRAALERLRAERIADIDQASKVMVAALADSAEVLTPAQRAKLGAAMAERHAKP